MGYNKISLNQFWFEIIIKLSGSSSVLNILLRDDYSSAKNQFVYKQKVKLN